MVRYIDVEAFLKHEEEIYCKNCDHRKNSKGKMVYAIGDAPCRACGICDVMGDVEDFPAADVVERPKWIPVEERLPERRRWVLCRCQANITEVMRFENAEWYHDPSHVYFFEFVTHWMPLPESPEEEKADG